MLENMADGGDDGHQMCGGETRDVGQGSLFVCRQLEGIICIYFIEIRSLDSTG